MEWLLALLGGMVVGSFLNVAIYRWPIQRSVVWPRSACGGCGVPLTWRDKLPVWAFLSQRGCCAHCGGSFSARYPLIEALTGAGAVGLLGVVGQLNWVWFYDFVVFCIAVVVFFTDFDHWIIPDEVNIFGFVFGCLGGLWLPLRPDDLGNNLLSSLAGAGLALAMFWTIQKVSLFLMRQEAMGDGDVKYAVALGALLGWKAYLVAIVLSFILGGLISLAIKLLMRGDLSSPVPFGTFMSLATVLVVGFESRIWDAYWTLSFTLGPGL